MPTTPNTHTRSIPANGQATPGGIDRQPFKLAVTVGHKIAGDLSTQSKESESIAVSYNILTPHQAALVTTAKESRESKRTSKQLAAMSGEYAVEELKRQTTRFQKYDKKGENRELRDVEWIPRSTRGKKRAKKPFGQQIRHITTATVSFTPRRPELVWWTAPITTIFAAAFEGQITKEEWAFYYKWMQLAETPRKPRSYHRTTL